MRRYRYSAQGFRPNIILFHDLSSQARIIFRLSKERVCIVDLATKLENGQETYFASITIHGPKGTVGSIRPLARALPLLAGAWVRASDQPEQRRMGVLAIENSEIDGEPNITVRVQFMQAHSEPIATEPGIGRFLSVGRSAGGNIYASLYQL